jgi:hypothetical protein
MDEAALSLGWPVLGQAQYHYRRTATPSPVTLLVNYFDNPEQGRAGQLAECLGLNVGNPFIDKVILVLEDGLLPPQEDPKIQVMRIPSGTRPTYKDWFVICKPLPGAKVIANADIYFDDSIQVLHWLDLTKQFWGLARWEQNQSGSCEPFQTSTAQDAWIFSDAIDLDLDYGLGWGRSDNKVAADLHAAGYDVRNPCLTVRAYHNHTAGAYRPWLHSPFLEGDCAGIRHAELVED